MKALPLKRISQQGEIELPPESRKLKSESDFWRHFRVSCLARWKTKWETLIYIFFCSKSSNFVGLFDVGSQSHNTVYALHRFMPGILSMTVSRSCKEKRVYQIQMYSAQEIVAQTYAICAKGDWALLCFA